MIFVPRRTVLVNNGDSAVLVCEADGIPQPNITWYRDGIQVRTVFPTSGQRSDVIGIGSLDFLPKTIVFATKYVNYIDVFGSFLCRTYVLHSMFICVFTLRCHVSGVFMSCDCRGVRADFIVAFTLYLVCARCSKCVK